MCIYLENNTINLCEGKCSPYLLLTTNWPKVPGELNCFLVSAANVRSRSCCGSDQRSDQNLRFNWSSAPVCVIFGLPFLQEVWEEIPVRPYHLPEGLSKPIVQVLNSFVSLFNLKVKPQKRREAEVADEAPLRASRIWPPAA